MTGFRDLVLQDLYAHLVSDEVLIHDDISALKMAAGNFLFVNYHRHRKF